jgi:hypothetical protein
MDFFKKIILSSIAYFILVMVWIRISEQRLDLLLLILQSFCFGIIAGGCLYFISIKKTSVSGSTDLDDKKEEEED